EPLSVSGSSGVTASTVPTFEASGQLAAAWLLRSICAGEHASRPSAAEGFTTIPGGSVTTASLKCDSASPFGTSLWGTRRSASRPVGEFAPLAWGVIVSEGLKSSRLQSVMPAGRPSRSWFTPLVSTNVPGSCHGSAWKDSDGGCAEQLVGSVRKGGGASLLGQPPSTGMVSPEPPRHSPR